MNTEKRNKINRFFWFGVWVAKKFLLAVSIVVLVGFIHSVLLSLILPLSLCVCMSMFVFWIDFLCKQYNLFECFPTPLFGVHSLFYVFILFFQTIRLAFTLSLSLFLSRMIVSPLLNKMSQCRPNRIQDRFNFSRKLKKCRERSLDFGSEK